ncbi:reverse transcriptase domain-containing protein [Tanacetum coccineum]
MNEQLQDLLRIKAEKHLREFATIFGAIRGTWNTNLSISKLFNERSGRAGSENSQTSPSPEEVGGYSFDGSSRSRSRGRSQSAQKNQKSVSRKKGISKSHRSVRLKARSRSKSKSVNSKPQSVKASRKKSSLDSGYDTVSDNSLEDLSMPYRNWFDSLDPKSVDGFEELSNKFLEEFSQQKRYDKDPTDIHGIKRKPNEGLQAFMDRFIA